MSETRTLIPSAGTSATTPAARGASGTSGISAPITDGQMMDKRTYRALIEARPLLHPNPDADREGYINPRAYAEQRGFDRDLSRAAYTLAMNVATALAALPEFPPERCDMICAACWKLNPRTGARGSVAHIDAVLVEVHRLGEEAAREEASAAAIVPVRSEI